MRRLLLPAIFVMITSSCARQQHQFASRPVTVFETQVRNAVHAGDGDLEVQALRKRLLDHPRDIAIRRRLAARFEASGYPDLALEHLRIAAELAPGDITLQLDLAATLASLGLKDQAHRVIMAAAALPTWDAHEYSRAAILLDQLESPAAAESWHRKALAIHPASFELQNNLAFNLMSQQRAAEAAQLFHSILRAHPTYELARNNLATLYATQLNNPEEALLHWKAVHGPAAAHNNLAAVYIEQEKWDEARRELERALALRFQFPEAIENLRIVASRTSGTVTLNLNSDSKPSRLSKLARAFRQAFTSEAPESPKSQIRRSRS
jgi:Flp pilus assembly protein TadD